VYQTKFVFNRILTQEAGGGASLNTVPRLMKPKEFARYSGLSVSRVYRLARANQISIVRLGGSSYVVVAEAMAFLESLPSYKSAPTSYWAGSAVPPRRRK
jgi:hypothetical protein